MWCPQQLKIIKAVKENLLLLLDSTNPYESMRLWKKISEEIDIPAAVIRRKWNKIKGVYLEKRRRKVCSRSKYMDGTLSFLDKYYLNEETLPQEEVVVDSINIDEDVEDGVTTLDLMALDDLLMQRGFSKGDAYVSEKDKISLLVLKRIKEAVLLLHNNIHETPLSTARVHPEALKDSVSSADTLRPIVFYLKRSNVVKENNPEITTNNDRLVIDIASDSQSSKEENRPSSDTIRPTVPSEVTMENSPTAVSIPRSEEEESEHNDVHIETIFDIHRKSDCKTFFQELERYIKQFSEKTQEEIRLKICCVISEAELDLLDEVSN